MPKVVHPIFEIIDVNNVMNNLERGARVCYKSEDKMGPGSAEAIVERILNFKHESVLEHGVVTVAFRTDRGVTHELVRHRLAAYSQESTRYCNYSKDKYNNEITLIDPFFFDPLEGCKDVVLPNFAFNEMTNSFCLAEVSAPVGVNSFDVWLLSALISEWAYNTLTGTFGRSAQEARSVLPNSLKTDIQVTANIREWRHIFRMRTARDAHPQIRQIMVPLAKIFAERWPVMFGEFKDVEHTCPAVEGKLLNS